MKGFDSLFEHELIAKPVKTRGSKCS